MFKIGITIFFLISFLFGEKPKEITLCHSRTDMVQWAFDSDFAALHPSPKKAMVTGLGNNISFAAADGLDAKGYFIKSKKKSNKWLFVYQEWWGLNDNIREESEKLYKDLGGKVNVLALDMYDGKSTTLPQEAGKLMAGTKNDRLEAIVKAGMAYAGPKAKIANIGWCFGGSWSLRSALLNGKQAVGSVIYYGMPVNDVEKLKTLNCDVLGLFATEERISKAVIKDFAAKMQTAGKNVEYKIFNGVHGFSNPSNPKHDPVITKEAYAMAISYLKKRLL